MAFSSPLPFFFFLWITLSFSYLLKATQIVATEPGLTFPVFWFQVQGHLREPILWTWGPGWETERGIWRHVGGSLEASLMYGPCQGKMGRWWFQWRPGTGVSPGRLRRWRVTAGVAAGIHSHAWLNPTADAAIWARRGGRLSEHRKTNSGTKEKPKISDWFQRTVWSLWNIKPILCKFDLGSVLICML